MNAFPSYIKNGRVSKYADDTIIYSDGKSYLKLSSNLNECLKDAASWYSANCLVLNVNKTVGMLICSITNDDQN